ncbi:probable mediator of RNA polymerase II transcription subunit 37c [Chenopodium quinoa]|uniref:probable mediator of RNA polymerase II transcription subunit 37c n=1 Tax=Chenopodium quinoa TaxID=63459 RepID=UPI000B788FB9|nr:probable mediator of RNA polymerase II transcription subunit 37c [Chenopodium quinoa]
MDIVKKCLKDAKMEKSDINDVVLVGGSTRIPKVQKMLQDLFNGKELCKSLNQDEAVAYGAAIHAAILSGVRHNQQVVLVDVTPLSIGTEIRSGELCVVIPRNTPIPTKMEKRFFTVLDNQTSMANHVYEGERPIARENNFLGEFTLHGIPPAPKGVSKVIDCFSIDANGILTVTSTDKSTGNNNHITITNHSGRLSKKEIDRMVEEAKKYRAKDTEHKKLARAKSELENYLTKIWDIVSGNSGGKVVIQGGTMEDIIQQTIQWLDWNVHLTEASKFEEKLKEIESICNPVITRMQKNGDDVGVKRTKTEPV